jgi:hypothetical protein
VLKMLTVPIGATLVATLVISAAPAGAVTRAPGSQQAIALATPTGGFVTTALNSDSCVVAPLYSESPFWCLAVGYYANASGEVPLGLGWTQGPPSSWLGDYPENDPNSPVNLPAEVSCVAVNDIPTCGMVGDHYRNPRYAAQLAEVSIDGEFNIVAQNNPAGSTWSQLLDVSCPAGTFCLMVGDAGTSRKVRHGVVYTSHATAYSWTGGRALTRLSPPAPAHARTSELAGVSCASATTCLAVGNYTNARGKWRTYSAAWDNGTWTVQPALNVPGQAGTTFQAVSCLSTTLCMAVGDSFGPGSRAFAQEWSAGTWQMSATPAGNRAGLTSISCPAASFCYASGFHGNHALIESWNGTGWSAHPTPPTKAPFSAGVLLHVSCASATQCLAVGYRFNPKTRPNRRTFRDLAESLTAGGWQVHNP